jgi:hypothetical protein
MNIPQHSIILIIGLYNMFTEFILVKKLTLHVHDQKGPFFILCNMFNMNIFNFLFSSFSVVDHGRNRTSYCRSTERIQ